MKYKISIIIPTYNIEEFLRETVGSIINQSIGFSNIELILVDDCSTDNTRTIINDYTKKYENVLSIFLESNTGFPGKGRNLGIEAATGEYLMIMDHDDAYPEKACEIFYNTITGENADIVVGRFKNFGEKTLESRSIKGDCVVESIYDNPDFLYLSPAAWTKIFKTRFIKDNNIRFLEDSLAEDLYFSSHAYFKSSKTVFIEDIIYLFRIRDSDVKSTSRLRNYKYTKSLLNGYYKVWELFIKEDGEYYFARTLALHLTWWSRNFLQGDIKRDEKIELLKYAKELFLFLNKNDFKPKNKAYVEFFYFVANEEYEAALKIGKMVLEYEKIVNSNKKLKKDLKTLKNSKSWKITKPLRKLKKQI
ncbi:MAG: glycosyltransferase family 2 protein [Methanobrevibacter sp.]|jgi:glycosyltransferase involved in cell wall biosynthesis|nr:glycosyltransferase family 2 protein [Methanobrevibacter sp.]